MVETKRRNVESGTVSQVGIGSATYTCDNPEHEHFETSDMAKAHEHRSRHKVLSGGAYCTECGERVIFSELDEKDRPTVRQIDNKLVFHPKCAAKFFKEKGFEVRQIK